MPRPTRIDAEREETLWTLKILEAWIAKARNGLDVRRFFVVLEIDEPDDRTSCWIRDRRVEQ